MKLKKLRSLFLNGNCLTELPSDFGSLKALKDGKFSVSAPGEVALEMLFWGWKGLKVDKLFRLFYFQKSLKETSAMNLEISKKRCKKAPWSLQNMFFFDFLVSVRTYILCQITCGDKFPCEFCLPPRSFILKITSCDPCPRVLEIWRSCESWASREIRTSFFVKKTTPRRCWVGTVIFLKIAWDLAEIPPKNPWSSNKPLKMGWWTDGICIICFGVLRY